MKDYKIGVLLVVLGVSVSVAFTTGILLPQSAIGAPWLRDISSGVGSVVPSVAVMSGRALNPVRAELTWALQWLFHPIYLSTLIIAIRPWSKETKLAVLRKAATLGDGQRLIVLLGIFLLGCLILADVGVIGGPSFLRGTVFDGDPAALPRSLRAPFTSNMGMVLYAWFVPLADAGAYWGFLFLLVHCRRYLNPHAFDGKLT